MIEFKATDVVDWDEAISYREGEFNPHGMRPWLFHDHGFVLCVLWASSLQDALDAAVDANKLDRFQIDPKNFGDYGDTEEEQWENMTCLGNASEPFDIENLGVIELSPEKFWETFNATKFSAHGKNHS